MSVRVTLVQGGAGGHDKAEAVKRVVAAVGGDVAWDEHLAGLASLQQGGELLPRAMLDSVRANGLALKTTLPPPPGMTAANWNVRFRRELGLFAAVRPLRNLAGLPARFQGVDILIIRELTEDLYAAIEHEVVPGVVQSLKVVTEAATRRFFQFAFDWARAAKRKSVTCVHKANILKQADGLLLEVFRETAKGYPELQTREIIVDNCCMQMVSRPQQFDVMAMGNLYGDMVSDVGAGVVGGTAATHGINVGEGVRVYESFHGSGGSDSEGRTSPVPLLLSAADLLESVGKKDSARRIVRALERVLTERRALTPDLGGQASTHAMTDAVLAALDGESHQ